MMLDLLWHSSRPRRVLPFRIEQTQSGTHLQSNSHIKALRVRQPIATSLGKMFATLRRFDPRPRVSRHGWTGRRHVPPHG